MTHSHPWAIIPCLLTFPRSVPLNRPVFGHALHLSHDTRSMGAGKVEVKEVKGEWEERRKKHECFEFTLQCVDQSSPAASLWQRSRPPLT